MTLGTILAFAAQHEGYPCCLVFSLVYVLSDLSQDFKDFPPFNAFFKNAFFWLYWLLQFLASSLAFYLLQTKLLSTWKNADVLQALIAVFGSSLVLQNQLVKLGSKSVVDFSGIQKGLRRQVIVQIGKLSVRGERNRILRVSDRLARRYAGHEDQLENLLKRVMLAAGLEESQIKASIERIRNRSEALGVSKVGELARVLAQTDIDQANRVAYGPEKTL